MANNIGNGNATSFFSILIPGGSTGLFNGCSNILGDNLGSQYGGLMGNVQIKLDIILMMKFFILEEKNVLKKNVLKFLLI